MIYFPTTVKTVALHRKHNGWNGKIQVPSGGVFTGKTKKRWTAKDNEYPRNFDGKGVHTDRWFCDIHRKFLNLFVETVTWLNCKFGQCLSMQYCNLLDKHVISSNSEPPKDQFLHCQRNFSRHSLWLVRVLPHKENRSILVSTSLYNCVHKCHYDFLRRDFSWAITSACLLHEKIASTWSCR